MISRSTLLGGAFGVALFLGLAGLPGVLRADVPARVMPTPGLGVLQSGLYYPVLTTKLISEPLQLDVQ